MSTNALDLFAFSAASKADRTPTTVSLPANLQPVWFALSGELLTVLTAAEEIARAVARGRRIAARLDDPSVSGTAQQRGQAEAAHWSCMETARREREAMHRAARRITSKLWKEAWEEHRSWVTHDMPRMWHGEKLWDVLRFDQMLAPLEPWRSLIAAHDALKPEDVDGPPF